MDNLTREIIKKVGADAICRTVGVTKHSVRHAATTGVFPSSWYKPLSDLCAEKGVSCSIDAFNWKSPSASAPENAGSV
jgi:hypothetical protein